MRKPIISAIVIPFLLATPGSAYENWGSVRVEANIANPQYPTHNVTINKDAPGRFGPSYLHARCENNKTEVFLSVDGIYGYNGKTRAKWIGMARGKRIGAVDSTDGQAVFFSNSIGFLSRLIKEGSVVLEVEGYNVRGAASYTLNDKLTDGIYALAKTCQWESRLQERLSDVENAAQANKTAVQAMIPKIQEIGKARFIELLDELLPE